MDEAIHDPGKRRLWYCITLLTGFVLAGCTSTLQVPSVVRPPVRTVTRNPALPVPEIEEGTETYTASLPDYYHIPGQTPPRPYKVLGKWYRPLAHAKGFRQQGLASWYGDDFHGKPTSTGERYNMHGISAAHKILPLGTWVQVTNLKNGKKLVMRVNDRGPFVSGRIIDLSFGAAKELGVVGPGTAPVEVVALGTMVTPPDRLKNTGPTFRPVDYNQGSFFIQVGAFGERQNAEKLAHALIRDYKKAQVKQAWCPANKRSLYRVLVGTCPSLDQAQKYEQSLRARGFRDAFTIAE